MTISYTYDGAQFLEERPNVGEAKRYVYGPRIDQALAQSVGSATSYFVADHLGSITRVTDSVGAPTLTREYDQWGNLLEGLTTSGYAFTGREQQLLDPNCRIAEKCDRHTVRAPDTSGRPGIEPNRYPRLG